MLPAEIWDCHGHLDAVRYHYISGGGGAETLLRFMDRVGIRTLCASHHLVVTGDLVEGNERSCDAAARFPGRILVYLGYNPNYPEEGSVAELDRHIRKPGVMGIKLHPSSHLARPDDVRYRGAFEYARRHGLIVLIHSWGMRDVAAVERVAREYPTVSMVIGHSGGYEFAAMEEAARVASVNGNVYLDLCLSGMFEGEVELLVGEAGADKLLFGSDMPFMDPRPNLGRVLFARIGDQDKERILGLNMKRLVESARTGG